MGSQENAPGTGGHADWRDDDHYTTLARLDRASWARIWFERDPNAVVKEVVGYPRRGKLPRCCSG